MADVADKAKVSKITVSRTIRTPMKVHAETRERVQMAIRALGYVPDEAAGALASGESRMVAAIVSTLESAVFAATIDGLGARLRERGHQVLLGDTGYSGTKEAELISAVFGYRPDGVVLTSSEHTDDALRLLKTTGAAVVEMWELPADPIDMAVGFSNVDVGVAMTRFLSDIGYRRIVYIGGGATPNLRARRRFDGYAQVCRDLGLGEPMAAPYDRSIASSAERGARSMAWILENRPDTDAVFCVSDGVALGALNEARRCGKRVPDDIAVAGLGNVEFADSTGLGLTTVRIPGFEMGEMAAQLIFERKYGGGQERKIVDLGFEIIRRSTA